MRKFSALFIAILIAVTVIPGAVFAQSGRISVWSFTDELQQITEEYFQKANSRIGISYNFIPLEQYQERVDPLLSSGRGAPDVFALEADFVRKYVESGLLLDLTDIWEANKNKLLAYPVEIGTHNGRVYALSWQACPGAMFYRRSLARKYLGTDDPAVVQKYFENFDKFIETSKLLNERSNGSCAITASINELMHPFLGARKQPWVVNGRLVIDPVMEKFMDIAKTLRDNRYDGGFYQWSDSWFAGMKDEIYNYDIYDGTPLEVFAYFMPTWGLHYVLKPNSNHTAGDWAMIQGPSSWHWGGIWIAASKNTPNAEAAKEFIRYIATDDSFHEQYAKDSGDMVTNQNVVNKIKNNYSEPFLGGQNHYAEFASYALNTSGQLNQSTDDVIQSIFMEALASYMNGEVSKAQALSEFRAGVANQLGIN